MSPKPQLPHAVFRIVPKQGESDCVIACLATILRRDYGEVLAEAARISRTVWKTGLSTPETLRTARRLKATVIYTEHFDPEEDIGILIVSFRDRANDHAVALIEGNVFDPEHDPVSRWAYEEFLSVQNAVPKGLIKLVEKP